MKNALFALSLLFSTAPAFALDPTTGVNEAIEEVKYQAQQCGGSAIKSAEMEEEDTDFSHEKISAREGERQTNCDRVEEKRMAALARLAADEPKPIVKASWFHKATSAEDNQISLIKTDRRACVIGAIYEGVEGGFGGVENAEAVENRKVAECEASARKRLAELNAAK